MTTLIKKILLPNKPQLDPITAAYLFLEYGQEKFPGIGNAKLIYWDHGRDPNNEEIETFQKEGVLMIDVGGGMLDHHVIRDNSKETSASLAASYLGIEKNPELSALLSYIREDDLEGLHNRFGDLAYIVKCMHKQGIPPNSVVGYTLQMLHILHGVQKEWHCVVKEEFEKKCKIYNIKHYTRKLKIGVIESDDLQVANYAITVNNTGVVIQKRSSGHIIILTNKSQHIDLREIIGAIRKRELELGGQNGFIDPMTLRFEGKNMLVPNWFFHRSLNGFLNGSDALCKVVPTNVSLEEIVRFVLYGLDAEKSKLCDCAEGGNKCPYVAYGFSKCRAQRMKSRPL